MHQSIHLINYTSFDSPSVRSIPHGICSKSICERNRDAVVRWYPIHVTLWICLMEKTSEVNGDRRHSQSASIYSYRSAHTTHLCRFLLEPNGTHHRRLMQCAQSNVCRINLVSTPNAIARNCNRFKRFDDGNGIRNCRDKIDPIAD